MPKAKSNAKRTKPGSAQSAPETVRTRGVRQAFATATRYLKKEARLETPGAEEALQALADYSDDAGSSAGVYEDAVTWYTDPRPDLGRFIVNHSDGTQVLVNGIAAWLLSSFLEENQHLKGF